MDSELKQRLEEMEMRLMARMTHAAEMETRLMAHAAEMETRRMTHAAEMETRLMAHTSQECERIETKLLTEFYKWGRTSDIRTRQALAEAAAIGERMLNVEDRVTTLERSKLPPQADAA